LINLKLDIDSLAISDFSKKYLEINNKNNALDVYNHIIRLALGNNNKPLHDLTLLDYGGGTGLLSILAKTMGIGTVIYCDTSSTMCKDAEVVSKSLDVKIDHYVCADIKELIEYSESHCLSIDILCSHDVIEHIRDVSSFIAQLPLLPSKKLTAVFSSGANGRNPLILYKTIKFHRKIEPTYRIARKEIISKAYPHLSESICDILAAKTRGLNKEEIEKVIGIYCTTGKLPYKREHPTNTCEPFSGYWSEHLMSTAKLKDIFVEHYFDTQILCGFYGESSWRKIVNPLIKIFGLILAPYYIIYAKTRASNPTSP
jgi:ubiquinone/menaquinone biosynthesis C-methylase UbiE